MPTATLRWPLRGRCRRGGYTLVELIVVMSVNSVLMAAAAVLLGMLLRSENQGRHHFEGTSAITRLADQFRADVAVASEASIATVAADNNANTAALPVDHLRLEDRGAPTIEYWQDGDRLRRAERKDQTVVSRESYKLSQLATVEFVCSPDKLISIRLTLRESNGAPDRWTIASQLGRDLRFFRSQP